MPEFIFTDPEVSARFEPVGVEQDFQIRTPAVKFAGWFSTITVAVAEQLIIEKYDRIREKLS